MAQLRTWSFIAAIAVLVFSSSLRASDELALTYRAGLVQPGDVLHLAVTAPAAATAVEARWNDRAVPFVRDADGVWRTLLGIDVAAPSGPSPLALSATLPDGAPVTSTETITVSPKSVRTRRITVNPKFVNPPSNVIPRIQQEAVLLNEVFQKTSAERHWSRNAVRPVEGVAVSGFGVRSVLNGQPRGPHTGLDLAAVTGTPVHAPTAGVVVYARDFYYSGNTVILDHGQGLYSTMAHLSAIDVKEGDTVAQGTLLGKVGATGRVTGAHLHWAVRLHGARVDPLSLLDVLTISRRPAP